MTTKLTDAPPAAQTIERRHTSAGSARVRIERQDDGPTKIIGYAAVFYREGEPGTEYELWQGLVERVMPGAFDRALREKDDVRGLLNHDRNLLLGRTEAGTLRLSVDQVGLRYEIDAPDTQAGRDLLVSLERGDLSGSSFSFWPDNNGGVVWRQEEDRDIRELHSVTVYDVAPTTFPAYEDTTAGLRASGFIDDHAAVRAEREQWRRERQSVAVRARRVEVEANEE